MAGPALVAAEAQVAGGSLSSKLTWDQANPKWASRLNPLLANPMNNGQMLNNVVLKSGDNVINHGLGHTLQGYLIILNNAAVTFYDKQATNSMPDLTLVLVASGAATISLYVF